VFLFKEFAAAATGIVSVISKELGEPVRLETALLKPVVRSGDIGPFWAKPEARVLFPYQVQDNEARLYSSHQMEERFANAWAYLRRSRRLLEAREENSFRDAEWFRFGRTQNLGMWEQPKIMVPYMITRLSAYLDLADHYYFINVTTGGYGITIDQSRCSLGFLCGLMNSAVLDFFLKRVSTNFHGGYFAANKQYIEQLPIASATPAQEAAVVRLVDYLLWLNRHFADHAESKTARDALMLGWWEQVLNGLVYELYFPDELHARGLHLFDEVAAAALPALTDLPEPQCIDLLRQHFERTYHIDAPLRAAVFGLGDLETVRIIEGKTS